MYDGKISTDKWFPVILVDTSNVGVAGKVHGDLTVYYHYEGTTPRVSYAPGAPNWVEAGGGEYWIRIGAGEFDYAGMYQISIACSGCQTHRIPIDVKSYTEEEKGTMLNTIYGRIGTPSDLGGGATIAFNLSDINSDVDSAAIDISSIYGKIGEPSDLGSGATIAFNLSDIDSSTGASAVEISSIYGKIGEPSDLGSGATLSFNLFDIDSDVDAVAVDVSLIYGRIGVPSDLGSGATLSLNALDIENDVFAVKTKVDTAIADISVVDGKVDTAIVDIATVDGKVDTAISDIGDVSSDIGSPIDLGDGTTLADNMTSIAGKTAGAATFNRTYDSLEALSDAESDDLSADVLKDLLFNREVTLRHINGKPQQVVAGTGLNQITVETTLDTDPGMTDFIDKEEIV